jgi:hypothetical protein
MSHGARLMSEKSNRDHDADDANDRELINMEFDSMVEGLSLDESSPSTYLDELENFVDQNRFIAPTPPRKSISASVQSALAAFKKWKDGKTDRDGDGVAL